jgi:hypothetical protein
MHTDIDGETRFEGCRYDIGADEFNDPCKGDFDTDGDIDGKDLADFAQGNYQLPQPGGDDFSEARRSGFFLSARASALRIRWARQV